MATQAEIDAIYQEQLGRAPDPAGYEAYADVPASDVEAAVKTSDEYLSYTTGATVTTLDANGTPIKVYQDLKIEDGSTFTQSHKEGDVFAVPQGTPVSSARNYEKVGTKEINGVDYDIYANAGSQGSGISGIVENVTGLDLNKIVPNEVKSGLIPIPGLSDPLGVTQGIVFGAGAEEGTDYLADITGLKPEEILMAQDLGMGVVALGTGNPYLAAGAISLKQTSDTAKTDEDWVDLSKNVALNFGIAGALDLAGNLLTKPTVTAPGAEPEYIDPFDTPVYGAGDIAPSTIAPSGTPGIYPIDNSTAGLSADVTNPLDASGLPPGVTMMDVPNNVTFIDGPVETVGAAGAGTSSIEDTMIAEKEANIAFKNASTAALNKPWYTEPATILAAGGLGLGIYGVTQKAKYEGQSLDDQMALIDYKAEQEKELLQMQLDAQAEMQAAALAESAAARAPVASTPPPSMYTKKYGVS